MPINSQHPDYKAHADRWVRIRDTVAGSDAVKAAGAKYLRRPEALSSQAFSEYVASATFYGASGRTLHGLTGAVFRKDPIIEVPERAAPLVATATPDGTPFTVFAKNTVKEVIAMGRAGVLVDVGGTGTPYAARYVAENILNWRTTNIAGKPVLTLLVLREPGQRPKEDDRFELESVDRFRVCELVRVQNRNGLQYQVSVYEHAPGPGGNEFELVLVEGPLTPMRSGQPLDFIPFTFFGPTSLSPSVDPSPLLPLVDVNISHFNTSACLEHGSWWTSLPVYIVSGNFQGGDMPSRLSVGSSVAWNLEPGADAKILEYTGQGLGALELRLERKEAHMAVLGARLLEDQKAGVEAAATVAMRHRGENSLLASIANTASRGLSQVLSTMAWWNGGQPASATVELNTDFFEAPLPPDGLLKLVGAWQQGGIGGRTLHHNLLKGERLPEGMTFEDWHEDIETFGPGAVIGGLSMFGEDEDEEENLNGPN